MQEDKKPRLSLPDHITRQERPGVIVSINIPEIYTRNYMYCNSICVTRLSYDTQQHYKALDKTGVFLFCFLLFAYKELSNKVFIIITDAIGRLVDMIPPLAEFMYFLNTIKQLLCVTGFSG